MPYLGELISLLTALVWSGAVILFRKSGETVHPAALNLFKTLMAIASFLVVSMVLGFPILEDRPLDDYLMLLASGAIGIALADTLFLAALNYLGATLAAIVDSTYAPFVAIFSFFWLGNDLSFLQILGIAVIGAAVILPTLGRRKARLTPLSPDLPLAVPADSGPPKGTPPDNRQVLVGLVAGTASMALMAIGVIMFKPLLDQTSVLWTTQVRLVGAALGLLGLLVVHPRRRSIVTSLLIKGGRRYTLSGAFLGGVVAMGCWMAGMKFAMAPVAAAINQTSNVFVFLLGALLLKEALNTRKVLGIVLGVAGILLVTFG